MLLKAFAMASCCGEVVEEAPVSACSTWPRLRVPSPPGLSVEMMFAANVWGVGVVCAARRAESAPDANWLDGARLSGLAAALEVEPAPDVGKFCPVRSAPKLTPEKAPPASACIC